MTASYGSKRRVERTRSETHRRHKNGGFAPPGPRLPKLGTLHHRPMNSITFSPRSTAATIAGKARRTCAISVRLSMLPTRSRKMVGPSSLATRRSEKSRSFVTSTAARVHRFLPNLLICCSHEANIRNLKGLESGTMQKSCGAGFPTLWLTAQNDLRATGTRMPGPWGEHEGQR
jgi:hypothetical protein